MVDDMTLPNGSFQQSPVRIHDRDPFAARMLLRQPRDIDAASALFDDSRKSLADSSPHVVDMAWLRENLCETPARLKLLERFEFFLEETRSVGAQAEAALIGGSFLSRRVDPADIDFLLFYSATSDFDSAKFRRLVGTKRAGLDFGVAPTDTGIVSIVKNAVFFHVLFQGEEGRRKGSLLLVL